MSTMDHDDLLAAAGARGDEPCLIEVGRALRADGETTGYFWSTGRIAATVGADWARLKRRLGVMGDGDMRINLAELRALDVACGDWACRRDEWARFFSYSGAPAPYQGFVHIYSYQPAGKGSAPVKIGRETRGRLQGEKLCGRDMVVPMEQAIELANDVRIEAEIWRRGERHGPPEGSLVGMRYHLGVDALILHAHRQVAKLARREHNVHLEAGEEAFVAAVLRVVERDSRPDREVAVKLWLDDVRPAPEGWILVRTAHEAIAALQAGGVTHISLDHDLGDDDAFGTGYDVACWIEEAVALRGFVPPEIAVHSANVVGRARMARAIESIERLISRRR